VQNKDNDSLINEILNGLDAINQETSSQDEYNEPSEIAPQDEFGTSIDEKNYDGALHNEEEIYPEEQPVIRKAPSGENISSMRPSAQGAKKKKKKKKRKKPRNRLPGVLILTTFIFAVSICLSLVIIAYGKDMLGIGKSETTQLIEIEEGATTEEIALLLESKGIIKSPEFFKLFSKLSKSDSKYLPGEYFISPSMAYETIIQKLTSLEYEQKESVEVTFPEGTTLYDAAYILEENGVCSAEDFIFFFNSGDLGFEFEDRIPINSGNKFYRMEGYLFPDTYFFYVGMDPTEVCQKIYLNFDNKMNTTVEFNGKSYTTRYDRMEELNLTLDELVTFASIVQKEAATKETMTMIASIFWNRINNKDKFPKLESDPTRLYSENIIKPNMQVYDQAMIDAYNTYTSPGLPPGAICNPGTEAIDAVLENFESTNYFFIANTMTGITYYSETYEEHLEYEAQIKEDIANAKANEEAAGNE